jgi:hypothetical protein
MPTPRHGMNTQSSASHARPQRGYERQVDKARKENAEREAGGQQRQRMRSVWRMNRRSHRRSPAPLATFDTNADSSTIVGGDFINKGRSKRKKENIKLS